MEKVEIFFVDYRLFVDAAESYCPLGMGAESGTAQLTAKPLACV